MGLCAPVFLGHMAQEPETHEVILFCLFPPDVGGIHGPHGPAASFLASFSPGRGGLCGRPATGPRPQVRAVSRLAAGGGIRRLL